VQAVAGVATGLDAHELCNTEVADRLLTGRCWAAKGTTSHAVDRQEVFRVKA
jgi:hypothetical protein